MEAAESSEGVRGLPLGGGIGMMLWAQVGRHQQDKLFDSMVGFMLVAKCTSLTLAATWVSPPGGSGLWLEGGAGRRRVMTSLGERVSKKGRVRGTKSPSPPLWDRDLQPSPLRCLP